MGSSVEGILSFFFSNGSAPLNNMAAMLLYGKTLKKSLFSRTKKASSLNLNIQHWDSKYTKFVQMMILG